MLNVYGIKNCNTVKKSLDWLANNNIEFQFHDVKKKYFRCKPNFVVGKETPRALYLGKYC